MFMYVGIRMYVLARAMACGCSEVDRDPFGSGKPSLGLKKLRIDIAGRRAVCNACLPQMFVVLIIGSSKIFVFFFFVYSLKRLRKYLNNEHFRIYSM